MAAKLSQNRNEYRCSIEVNQNGKYCVRIRATFGRHSWLLPVYFLASSFDRAMKKLQQSLQFLQHQEDRLWFWGVDRSDDPNLAAEMLREAGLRLDRRTELPRKAADRKSTRLNSSHGYISYAVFCLKKKKKKISRRSPHNV